MNEKVGIDEKKNEKRNKNVKTGKLEEESMTTEGGKKKGKKRKKKTKCETVELHTTSR